jgi:hypothetical protein
LIIELSNPLGGTFASDNLALLSGSLKKGRHYSRLVFFLSFIIRCKVIPSLFLEILPISGKFDVESLSVPRPPNFCETLRFKS